MLGRHHFDPRHRMSHTLDNPCLAAAFLDARTSAFFPDGRWQANFLVNLGYGDPSGNRPRGPRLGFDDIARIE